MERNEEKMKRQSKVMSIVALAVCVVGLTIGFAAFSNTLTIKSGATVTPNQSDFNVEFSTSRDSVTYGTISASNGTGTATIKAGVDTIEDILFTNLEQGEFGEFTFYIHNTGKYTAYLNGINMELVPGHDVVRKCTPKSGKDNPLVTEICESLEYGVSFDFDGEEMLRTDMTNEELDENFGEYIDEDYEELKGPHLEPGEVMEVKFVMGYNYGLSDEEFTIELGDINFLFESVD